MQEFCRYVLYTTLISLYLPEACLGSLRLAPAIRTTEHTNDRAEMYTYKKRIKIEINDYRSIAMSAYFIIHTNDFIS